MHPKREEIEKDITLHSPWDCHANPFHNKNAEHKKDTCDLCKNSNALKAWFKNLREEQKSKRDDKKSKKENNKDK